MRSRGCRSTGSTRRTCTYSVRHNRDTLYRQRIHARTLYVHTYTHTHTTHVCACNRTSQSLALLREVLVAVWVRVRVCAVYLEEKCHARASTHLAHTLHTSAHASRRLYANKPERCACEMRRCDRCVCVCTYARSHAYITQHAAALHSGRSTSNVSAHRRR